MQHLDLLKLKVSGGGSDDPAVAARLPERIYFELSKSNARNGASEKQSQTENLPIGLRLAIAAGLDAERPVPGIASSRAISILERRLVGGLICTLSRGRPLRS